MGSGVQATRGVDHPLFSIDDAQAFSLFNSLDEIQVIVQFFKLASVSCMRKGAIRP